jgi:hypothetical protein
MERCASIYMSDVSTPSSPSGPRPLTPYFTYNLSFSSVYFFKLQDTSFGSCFFCGRSLDGSLALGYDES